MAGNSDPLFIRVGKINGVSVTAANTSSRGTGTIGTDIFLVFQADATNGSYVKRVDFMATASTPTTTTATVGRLYVSSVSSGATSITDTDLIAEVTLPATAADNATAGTSPVSISLDLVLPPGYTLLATNHAAPAANTAWQVTAFGGDY